MGHTLVYFFGNIILVHFILCILCIQYVYKDIHKDVTHQMSPPSRGSIATMMDFISDIQRHIVMDDDRIKLVNGCAGSRKTDTIVKLGIRHVLEKKHNILFLTLVSSITHELKCRLEKLLQITIPRVGSSNHYMGSYEGCDISIANFDAFVHRQLEHMGMSELLQENGDCHDLKTKVLYEATRDRKHNDLIMKNGKPADFVLVDEFQDMDPLKAKILTNVLCHNERIYGIAVGDMVQSVFPRAVSNDLALGHPMNIWKSTLKPKVYNIDCCYRCPAGHIDFVRLLLSDYYQKYSVPVMVSSNNDKVNKPVLFTHDKVSKNQSAYTLSSQVCAAIKALFEYDSTLRPEDVAIIMKKSNNNHVFEQLKPMLQKVYNKIFSGDEELPTATGTNTGTTTDTDTATATTTGTNIEEQEKKVKSHVVHFETRGDGYHNSIDWGKATGKTVMLSIHGDKGKGHRVVFFLGVSHRSLPAENNLFKSQELIDVSLMNVGLTRSTEYVFVGFAADGPSRYLQLKADMLSEYAYLAWDATKWSQVVDDFREYLPGAPPPPYREAIVAMNDAFLRSCDELLMPNFEREIRMQPLSCPDKDLLRVTEDVAKDMATAFEGIMQDPEIKPKVEVFGTRFQIRSGVTEDMLPILGIMGEILVYRKLYLDHGNLFLKKVFACVTGKNNDVRYVDDDRILNLVSDSMLNQYIRDPDMYRYTVRGIIRKHSSLLAKEDHLALFFRDILASERPVAVLSEVFASETFQKQLRVFLSKMESNKIPTRVYWNIALCFNELCESLRRPCVLLHFNRFNERIEVLHDNVAKFCDKFLRDRIDHLSFQESHRLSTRETDPDVLKSLHGFVNHPDLDADKFTRGYVYGITGRSDIVDLDAGSLYELKTSSRVDMSREWVSQALLYCCVPLLKKDKEQKEQKDQSCSSSTTETEQFQPKSFSVVNLMSGLLHEHTLPKKLETRELLQRVFAHYNFDKSMIEKLLGY